MKVKQHKVGEQFVKCKMLLEVRESFSCEGCAVFDASTDRCTDAEGLKFEPCWIYDREDRKSVIFAKIGDVKE
jgi:hypothetical protein